jgi:hypothetical protein
MEPLKILLVLLPLLSLFTGRFATLLDKRIYEEEIPATDNICIYFAKQFMLTLIAYKILIPTQHYRRWEARNGNEAITIRTIRIMYALSIGSLFGTLLVFALIMYSGR